MNGSFDSPSNVIRFILPIRCSPPHPFARIEELQKRLAEE
jgi:hypothetical protein